MKKSGETLLLFHCGGLWSGAVCRIRLSGLYVSGGPATACQEHSKPQGLGPVAGSERSRGHDNSPIGAIGPARGTDSPNYAVAASSSA